MVGAAAINQRDPCRFAKWYTYITTTAFVRDLWQLMKIGW